MTASQDVSTLKTYEDVYQVIADSGSSSAAVRDCLGYSITDTYPDDNDCTLRSKTARLTATSTEGGTLYYIWDLSLSWATGMEQISLAPWERDSITSWSTTTFQKEIWEDIKGKKILSTNQLPWQNQTMCDDSRIEVSIQNFIQTFDGKKYYNLRDCLNKSTFLGGPPKTVKFAGMQVNEVVDDPIWGTYWSKTVSFQFDPIGWQLKRIATGMKQINPFIDKLVPIIVGGQVCNEPVCLDGDGNPIPIGQEPLMLNFDIYNVADLSVLL